MARAEKWRAAQAPSSSDWGGSGAASSGWSWVAIGERGGKNKGTDKGKAKGKGEGKTKDTGKAKGAGSGHPRTRR